MPMTWIKQDSRGNQLAEAGLDAPSLAARAKDIAASPMSVH